MITVRVATVGDAPGMGRVMVETYLEAHREHTPEEAWLKRKEEWTPDVSAHSWKRGLRELAESPELRECYFVAEDASGQIVGVAKGEPAEGADGVGEVCALYVLPGFHGQGIGRSLVAAVAETMVGWGFNVLHIATLKANLPARKFYEAIGGQPVAERMFDEEGFLLPEIVYEWRDISVLTSLVQRESGKG